MAWWDPSSWGQGEDPNKVKSEARGQLNTAADASGKFANTAQNYYGRSTGHLDNTYGQIGSAMNHLQGQMMGQNSIAAEQLRQGNQQALSAQRSLAASASPQNAAMAARTAAIQTGRLNSGLAGQQAMAGIQERNQAASQFGQLGSALGQLQLGSRGQDANVALGARGNQLQGYSGVLNGQQNQGFLSRNKDTLQAAGAAFGVGGGGNGGAGK